MIKNKGVFITGTDTGVGKTYVACQMISQLKKRFKTGVMKPAESGCKIGEGGDLIPEDAIKLRNCSNCNLSMELICPYPLPFALAPAEASRKSGIKIEIDRIIKAYQVIYDSSDIVIVEGAGGFLVPLSGKYLFADLIKELNLPLLIIAREKLGTINHSLLTIKAALARNIEVLAIILNESDFNSRDESYESNRIVLQSLTTITVIGSITFSKEENVDNQNIIRKINELIFL